MTDKKIVLCVFEDHVDALVFQYDLSQRCEIDMLKLSIELVTRDMFISWTCFFSREMID